MHFLVVVVLVWVPFAVFSSTYCPSSVSPKRGYYTPGSSNNTSASASQRYFSQSWAKLAEVVETIAETEHPGWDLVLNSPVDGSRAPICYQLYINGKLWPEGNLQAQRCGASFYPDGAMPERLICPKGYILQQGVCVNQNPNSNVCPYKEQAVGEQDCCVGNPIYPSTGNKFEKEIDYQSGGPFPFLWIRYYNSDLPDTTRFGPQWRHYFDRRVWILPTNFGAILERADGKRIPFSNQHADGYTAQDPNLGRLMRLPQGKFWYRDRKTGISEYYDGVGKLSNLVYPGGYMQQLIYDNLGRLVKVQDSFGKQITLFYDNHQRIAEMHTPGGQSYQYVYDEMGRLSKVLYPDGTAKTYVYESKEAPNLLTGILNEADIRISSWQYDEKERAITSSHVLGSEDTSVYYDDERGFRLVKDAGGDFCRYEYITLLGQTKISKVNGPGCTTCPQGAQLSYDTQGNITQFIDCKGVITDYKRDQLGREIKRIEGVGTTAARTIKTIWHEDFNLPISIELPLLTMTFEYNSEGLLTTKTETANGSSRVWRYRYQDKGLLVEQDGPREDEADITRFSYDDKGQLLSIQNAFGHTTHIRAYDLDRRPLVLVDPNGLESQFAYDVRGRLTLVRTGERQSTFIYNPLGELESVIYPNKTKTNYGYDAAGRPVHLEMQNGAKYTFLYDNSNNLIEQRLFSAEGELASQEHWSYDNRHFPLQYIDGLGHTTRWDYDTVKRLTNIKDPKNNLTQYHQDIFGRLKQIQDALGGNTAFEYNAQDRVIAWHDTNSLTTQWLQNGFGQVEERHSHTEGTSRYRYDSAGNLISYSNALGQNIARQFDALNRLTHIASSDENIHFWYDEESYGKGKLTKIQYSLGKVHYVYNAWGELTQQTESVCLHGACTEFKQSFEHDIGGKLQSHGYPSGHTLRYIRNAKGEIVQMLFDVGGDPLEVISQIRYTPWGKIRSGVLGNGLIVDRQYDRNRNPTKQQTGRFVFDYAYDPNQNITHVTEPEKVFSLEYDALSRLIKTATGGYQYDGVGNRILKNHDQPTEYQYASGMYQLAKVMENTDTFSFVYDAAGRVVQRGKQQFTYDGLGRLKQIKTGTQQADYFYNPFGLRIAKVVASHPTYFVYNPEGVLIAEYNANFLPIREYLYLEGQPIAFFEKGIIYYIHTDQVGMPRFMTNSTQQVVWKASFSAFGEPVILTSAPISMPLRFPGQYYDAESGLNYNWHRYYDPTIGRYLQPDPISFAGGTNPYVYALNNPMKFIDPMGLDGTHAAEWALSKVENTDYQVWDPHPEIRGKIVEKIGGRFAPKCNAFVWDALTAGGDPPRRMSGGRIPTTADWETEKVFGYRPLRSGELPLLGDVVVDNGHIGLYLPFENRVPGTVSASSKLPYPKIVHKSWGFDPNDSPKIFRCECDDN